MQGLWFGASSEQRNGEPQLETHPQISAWTSLNRRDPYSMVRYYLLPATQTTCTDRPTELPTWPLDNCINGYSFGSRQEETRRPSRKLGRVTVDAQTCSHWRDVVHDMILGLLSCPSGNPFFFSDTSNHRPLIQEDPVDGDDVMQCKANYHITYRPQNDAMQCITSV